MNFWNQLVGSVMKIDHYLIFIKRSTGQAISYLICLTFIASLLTGIQISLQWNYAVDLIGREIQTNSPDFVFKDGELKVNAPMPCIITKKSDELFIIDTSGKTDESILKGYKRGTFIGKDKFVTKKNAVETQSYDLSDIKPLTFTKADIVQNMPWLKWLNIFIAFFMFIFGIIANLVAALLVSICGLIASKIMNCKIEFTDLYKISIYALTLPLFLELVRDLTTASTLLFKLGFYIIAILYIVRVLKLLKNTVKEETTVI